VFRGKPVLPQPASNQMLPSTFILHRPPHCTALLLQKPRHVRRRKRKKICVNTNRPRSRLSTTYMSALYTLYRTTNIHAPSPSANKQSLGQEIFEQGQYYKDDIYTNSVAHQRQRTRLSNTSHSIPFPISHTLQLTPTPQQLTPGATNRQLPRLLNLCLEKHRVPYFPHLSLQCLARQHHPCESNFDILKRPIRL
jgi:hypothetical protein